MSRHTQGIYDVVIFSQLSQRKCSSLGKPRLSAPPALEGPAIEPRLCQSSALLACDPCRFQRSAAPAFVAISGADDKVSVVMERILYGARALPDEYS